MAWNQASPTRAFSGRQWWVYLSLGFWWVPYICSDLCIRLEADLMWKENLSCTLAALIQVKHPFFDTLHSVQKEHLNIESSLEWVIFRHLPRKRVIKNTELRRYIWKVEENQLAPEGGNYFFSKRSKYREIQMLKTKRNDSWNYKNDLVTRKWLRSHHLMRLSKLCVPTVPH